MVPKANFGLDGKGLDFRVNFTQIFLIRYNDESALKSINKCFIAFYMIGTRDLMGEMETGEKKEEDDKKGQQQTRRNTWPHVV